MFEIFKTGLGSYMIIPYNPMDGPLMLIAELIMLCMVIGLAIFLKAFLIIPITCMVITIVFVLAFWGSNLLKVLTVLAIPMGAYAFESLGWVMFEGTEYTTEAPSALLTWLLIAIPVLMGLAGMYSILQEEIIEDVMSALIMGVMCVLALFLWGAPLYVSVTDGNESAFKYIFRCVWIITAICAIVFLISTIKSLIQTKTGAKGLAVDLIMLGLGFAPMLTAGIFHGLGGSSAGSVILCIIVLSVFAGAGYLVELLINKIGAREMQMSLGLMLLPFTVFGVFYFFSVADTSLLLPYGEVRHWINLTHDAPITIFAGQFEAALGAFGDVFSMLTYGIVSLIFRIFDTTVPHFQIPEFISFLFSYIPVVLVIGLGSGLYHKLEKKRQ